MGERLPACDADAHGRGADGGAARADCGEQLKPLLEAVESLTEKIHELDTTIEQIARSKYPETELLQQVSGVGTLIALTFVLTLEDRERFQKSRDVGCYVGLRPKQSESGQSQPQLRISKEGDRYLRTLLVQGAHCILRRQGAGYGSEAVGPEAGRARRQERQEASDRGGGAEIGGVAAPVVGRRRSVRAAAQQPGQRRFPARQPKTCSRVLVNPSPSSGDCEVAAERAFPETEATQFGTEMAAPVTR